MQKILQWKLAILARLYLWRYKPLIIGVTGNTGKTSTKEMIGVVVRKVKTVRVATGNLNNEFGLPLAILGNFDEEYYKQGPSLWFWSKVLVVSSWLLVVGSEYPEVLILEYGADHPGDIKKLAHTYKPHISVVTTVGDIPVHVEFFKDADAIAAEKANLVSVLSPSDYAILSYDDYRVFEMKVKTKAQVLTYGFDEGAIIRAFDVEYMSDENGRPLGMSFKLHDEESSIPVQIEGSLGKSQALSCAAAVAVGSIFRMSLHDVARALVEYRGPKGRLKILAGIKNSWLIDDTYNAAPASAKLALETLRDLPQSHGGRKIAVLGDMLELGEFTEQAHKEIGALAGEVVDVLVCVGARAKFIYAAASEKLPADKIFKYETSDEAKIKIQELVQENDLVLVKGSQGMRMEKIVEEIMAEPEKKRDLLVRQSKKWLNG